MEKLVLHCNTCQKGDGDLIDIARMRHAATPAVNLPQVRFPVITAALLSLSRGRGCSSDMRNRMPQEVRGLVDSSSKRLKPFVS
jgi:hypothetical protein